ncbi:glycosyltransferase family 39 protein [Candidatus Daviesbacteria bacterium]|nr:glycosyltransferase family 39 protein [Candidatus Daviesbacteria bacterium]
MVLGYRIKRQDPLFRILFKKGWKLSLLTFFGLTFKDVDCGFKMIRKSVLENIPHLESTRGAMINAELAIKTRKYGFKVTQVGVNHYPRLSGKPTGGSIRVIVKSFLDLLRLWWKLKEQKILFMLLLAVLALAAFLRLYKIDEYMIFLGDQGRDAIIVKNMIDDLHFPAIGPPTSVGNIYLGPLYYYMMLLPMVLTNFNPVSASWMVAMIGVATVFLVYYLGKSWFGRGAGLLAAYLYAISPVTVNYSRFSWNPNPLPFFAFVAILGMVKLQKTNNFFWLILTGFALGAALQMHYLALVLIPVIVTLWLYQVIQEKKKNFLKGTLLGLGAFLLVMSPLFWFDIRHNFLNYKAVTALFGKGEAVGINLFSNIGRIPEIYNNVLIGRYMAGENILLSAFLSLTVLALLIYWFIKRKVILAVWVVVGLLGLSFYQNDIYDHYPGFLNPAPYLLLGSLLALRKFKWAIAGLVIIITIVNLQKNPLFNSPNNQLKRTQEIAEFVINKAGGQDFNFALLAKNNYDSAYQFYLEVYGYEPKKLPFEKTEQLFVVCEDEVCEPIYSPKHEIAAFGWTLVDKEWDFAGVKIYKLVHNPKEPQ